MIQLLDYAEHKIREQQPQVAVDICNKILKETSSDKAEFLLSTALANLGRLDEAIEISKKLAVNPRAMSNLALLYTKSGNIEKATAEYKKAIKRDDCDLLIHANYAYHLRDIDIDECLSYMKKITKKFNHESLWYAYGSIMNSLNQFIEAKDYYSRSVQIKPNALARYELSLVHFHLGEYKEGWEHYEARWEACWLFDKLRKEVPGKFWSGENLEGKSILLWCEQGIGDLILFIRYAKELEKMGAKVSLKYQDPIFPYGLEGSFKTPHKPGLPTGYGDNTNAIFDYNCSILTVAGILGADVKTASGKPYLKSTKRKLPESEDKKIGLCWCGNSGHPKDKERSIKLNEFGLNKVYSLVKDYSLKQYEDGEIIDWCEGYKKSTIDLSSYLKNLNHTAQVIEWLDVVITVDTLVAHLAGALGKKTYLLLSNNCDWRWWDEKEETTPWYDSITLIRQKNPGSWDNEIKILKEKLWT